MISSLFSFFSQASPRNQRREARYAVGGLRAWIQRPGLLGMFDNHMELSPIDFNKTGMAFRHDDLLIPGQSIVMDIKKDDHELANIVAVVRYTSQHGSHYRSGVGFIFDVNDHMGSKEVKQTLNDIELLLIGAVPLTDA